MPTTQTRRNDVVVRGRWVVAGPSRPASPVDRLPPSTTAVTLSCSSEAASSLASSSATWLNVPRTVLFIMWRTAKMTTEWEASRAWHTDQVGSRRPTGSRRWVRVSRQQAGTADVMATGIVRFGLRSVFPTISASHSGASRNRASASSRVIGMGGSRGGGIGRSWKPALAPEGRKRRQRQTRDRDGQRADDDLSWVSCRSATARAWPPSGCPSCSGPQT